MERAEICKALFWIAFSIMTFLVIKEAWKLSKKKVFN